MEVFDANHHSNTCAAAVSEGRWEVRFFTDTFHLEHGREEHVEYRLLRRIPEATVVQSVLVGGKQVPFSRENGFLTFETYAQRPGTLLVRVDVAPIQSTRVYSFGIQYQGSVALRRGLSEFRDNVIARNSSLMRTARRGLENFRKIKAYRHCTDKCNGVNN